MIHSLSEPSFSYNRPDRIRKIPLKALSYRGSLTTTKLHLKDRENPVTFDYESALERDLYYCLDHDYYCYDFQPQPAEIHWTDKNGNSRVSYPDCWAVFITGKQILYQVKPARKLDQLKEDNKWNNEIETLIKYCQNNGWELRVITELEIRTKRLSNINILRGAAQHPPKDATIKKTLSILPKLFQNGTGRTYSWLSAAIHKKNGFRIQNASYILQYLLYYQVMTFDWNVLLNKSTLVYPNFEHQTLLKPFYESTPIQKDKKEISPVITGLDIHSLSSDQIEETNRKYEAIKDIVENPDRVKSDVEKRAIEIGVTSRTLYNWMKSYEQYGWKGLVEKNVEKGNRSFRFSEEVEKLIQKSISKHLRNQSSIKSCWKEIHDECQKINVDSPKYTTIRKRISKLPARERLGKQGGFIRYEISQSVMSNLPTGHRPLDFVQMDHTLLDIVLVDRKYRKAIGRPWLTLAIDTYSRMVYGYFLSLSPPNSLSVTRALMTGFLPKDKILERFAISDPYPIQGLPKKLQIDNSREFRSKHLEQFCLMYHIDLEFRPVRRPDKGAYIERLFGTINRAIRDERIPGYAPPLMNRPKTYNPDAVAEKKGLTLPEFEQWLINFFVTSYHTRIHSGLDRSPLEQYQIGIAGLEDSLGTTAIIPDDLTKLIFDILPISTREHRVHPYGIRWLGNNYNSPVLANFRKKKRGESKKIQFRYDPMDISQIWIYARSDRCYYPIPLIGGKLVAFVKNNPEIPISLSEYKAYTKIMKETKGKTDPMSVEIGLLERKELIEESKRKSKRARRESEKKRNCYNKKEEVTRNIPVIEKEAEDEDDEPVTPYETDIDKIRQQVVGRFTGRKKDEENQLN